MWKTIGAIVIVSVFITLWSIGFIVLQSSKVVYLPANNATQAIMLEGTLVRSGEDRYLVFCLDKDKVSVIDTREFFRAWIVTGGCKEKVEGKVF